MIIIDRVENDIAVVEYQGKIYNIPKEWLPAKAREGDVVILTTAIDAHETARRKNEIEKKMNDLFE